VKILLVGGGAREHALLWKLRRDAPEARFFIAPGNGGTDALATALPFEATEIQALAGWAEGEAIDLTIVGPEVPLADGIVDHFAQRGLAGFGPMSAAAEIESSKAFAKALMAKHGIPTAHFEAFGERSAAERHVREMGAPLVIKASGLAAGKGAIVCDTMDEGLAAVREFMGGSLGDAGRHVVVEEFMEGEELSVFALSDGEHVIPLLPSQDHKRIGDGDTGPNTGGMGAYAPVSLATPELVARIRDEILLPTVAAMRAEGRPFRGLLYAGLMLTAEGPKVVEFNCRFGDPETQVVLPLLEGSLLEALREVAYGGSIAGWEPRWRPEAAVTTVVASAGYPGDYPKGVPIRIPEELEAADDLLVFHAGTARRDGELVTSGGRVLSVTAIAPTVAEAAERSRHAAERIDFEGKQFRRDIGWREIAR
jgi:phosphoribosylamine--glycine ligase